MRVLVTGGSGFIGTHVTASLVGSGHTVRVLDHNPPRTTGVDWIKGELSSSNDVEAATRDTEGVVHLAGRVLRDPRDGDDPRPTFADAEGTRLLLSASSRSGVSQFIFASSAEVYGETSLKGANEESPCKPATSYGEGKLLAEGHVLAQARANPGMSCSILRVFNTFGEWQRPYRPGSAAATFIVRGLKGGDIVIHGDGGQVRDYLDVKDVARAFVASLETRGEGIYNVASGVPLRIKELADLVLSKLGRGKVTFAKGPIGGGVACSVGDSLKLRKATGWRPQTKTEDALDRVIGWYSENLALYIDTEPA
ncbi:MAG: NAD(P)-dependent oxidoreductase [Thaumarchaeota archaeon]|nr:NAD(P)-dependent oxidoreductase [Nitrososphaerota archaeon]